MLIKIRNLWCEMLHSRRTWPIHGHYECRSCGRQFPVPWSESSAPATLNSAYLRN